MLAKRIFIGAVVCSMIMAVPAEGKNWHERLYRHPQPKTSLFSLKNLTFVGCGMGLGIAGLLADRKWNNSAITNKLTGPFSSAADTAAQYGQKALDYAATYPTLAAAGTHVRNTFTVFKDFAVGAWYRRTAVATCVQRRWNRLINWFAPSNENLHLDQLFQEAPVISEPKNFSRADRNNTLRSLLEVATRANDTESIADLNYELNRDTDTVQD